MNDYARLAISAVLMATFLFVVSQGCVSEKYSLGNNDDYTSVKSVRIFASGREVSSISDLKVGEHLIIEGKAYNQRGETIPNTYVSMNSTDDKIIKILTGYISQDSFYSVVRGEIIGSAEVIVSAGNVAKPLRIGIGEGAAGAAKPYIKFRNVTSDAIRVGTSKEFIADYVNEASASAETSLVWTLPNDIVAKIASTTKNSATIEGKSTGEVLLLVRDAANTAAAGVVIKVN